MANCSQHRNKAINVREIVDNAAPKEGLDLEVGAFNSDELQKKSDGWMKDLRKNAKIIVR